MPAAFEPTRRALVPVVPQQSTSQDESSAVIRRYRLSRVSLYTRPDPSLDRHAHLRRSYD